MYIGLFLIILAVLFAVVGIFSGGAFTVVLWALGVVAVVGAVVAIVAARAAGIRGTLTKEPDRQPGGRIPRGSGPPPGEVPATPDEFVEARQRSQ